MGTDVIWAHRGSLSLATTLGAWQRSTLRALSEQGGPLSVTARACRQAGGSRGSPGFPLPPPENDKSRGVSPLASWDLHPQLLPTAKPCLHLHGFLMGLRARRAWMCWLELADRCCMRLLRWSLLRSADALTS